MTMEENKGPLIHLKGAAACNGASAGGKHRAGSDKKKFAALQIQ